MGGDETAGVRSLSNINHSGGGNKEKEKVRSNWAWKKAIWKVFRDNTKSIENIREKESIKGKVEEIAKRILETQCLGRRLEKTTKHFGMNSYLH